MTSDNEQTEKKTEASLSTLQLAPASLATRTSVPLEVQAATPPPTEHTPGTPLSPAIINKAWTTAAILLMASILGILFIIGLSVWQTLAWLRDTKDLGNMFIVTSIGLIYNSILRDIAALTGIALAAGGLLVSFLTINQTIGVAATANEKNLADLKTNSPGVIAIVFGSLIIIASLYFKGEFNLKDGSMSTGTKQSSTESKAEPAAGDVKPEILPDAKSGQK